MRPIKINDTGRGVADIQRRLQSLGYNLGACGVDGDFQEETQAAVEEFQRTFDLPLTGEVDIRTWSKLVDSTFVFGDRSLYLRRPHFHGQDVRTLQCALGALGFSDGVIDGIFGPHTERGVIEFQKNMDISPDGAVGQQTYQALNGLRHMWDNRQVHAHSCATKATQNREIALMRCPWCFMAVDDATNQIVRRMVNLASASAEDADVSCERIDDARKVLAADTAADATGGIAHGIACVLVSREGHANPFKQVVGGDSDGVSFDGTSQDCDVANTACFSIPYYTSRSILFPAAREIIGDASPTDAVFIFNIPNDMLDTNDKLSYQFIATVILDTLCEIFE
jgi:hypothetical protein